MREVGLFLALSMLVASMLHLYGAVRAMRRDDFKASYRNTIAAVAALAVALGTGIGALLS